MEVTSGDTDRGCRNPKITLVGMSVVGNPRTICKMHPSIKGGTKLNLDLDLEGVACLSWQIV